MCLKFNYPVDKKSLENKLSYDVKDEKDKLIKVMKGEVFLDETETIAYLHSDPIKLGTKHQQYCDDK